MSQVFNKFIGTVLLFSLIPENQASSQIINTFAGNGTAGKTGDGGLAISAELYNPWGVCVDKSGNAYISDYLNNKVRKVDAAGIITTFAGTGIAGYLGDGGPAAAAELNKPSAIAVDTSGNVYVSDLGNSVVRKITVATGIISTIAGTGVAGYNGDNIAATAAKINDPQGLFVDAQGNVFIGDANNYRVRKVTASSGLISTVAGNGSGGFSGDGGPATNATFFFPAAVYVDATGNIFISDYLNGRVREVYAGTGNVNTIAGNGSYGVTGDGGLATAAGMTYASGLWVDVNENVFIADVEGNRVREVTASTGIINTIAGTGTAGYSGDGGPAKNAELQNPQGICLDPCGNLYIADLTNNRIRTVSSVTSGFSCSISLTGPNPVCMGSAISLEATSGAEKYKWSTGDSSETVSVIPIASTTYTVTLTSSFGCTATATRFIPVDSLPLVKITALSDLKCLPGARGSATALASGGSGSGYTYSWDNGATGKADTSLAAGTYTMFVTDGNGCTGSTTALIRQSVFGGVKVNSNQTITQGQKVQLSASGGTSYIWSPVASLNNPDSSDPVADPSRTTMYTVLVTDSNNCTGTDSVRITVEIQNNCDSTALFVPSAFSPNGDGVNDIFYVRGTTCITKFRFSIFDRWGEQVFSADNQESGWDGTFRGQLMNAAVFVYYLSVDFSNGQGVSRKGTVTLLH